MRRWAIALLVLAAPAPSPGECEKCPAVECATADPRQCGPGCLCAPLSPGSERGICSSIDIPPPAGALQ